MKGESALRFCASAIGALILLASFAIASAQTTVLSSDDTARVRDRVQAMRGLKFTSKVPISYLSVDQVETRFKAEFAHQLSERELETSVEENKMIGLYPADFKIDKDRMAMTALELAGFYDPRRKDLVIVDRPLSVVVPERLRNAVEMYEKLETAGVLAHEFTHALQDQNYQIGTTQQHNKGNDDRELAFKAVVEGDATLSGFGVVFGRLDEASMDYLLSHLQEVAPVFMARTEGMPHAMTELMLFQYFDGACFVADAFHRKGWPGVNALFTKPPQSTQQILHPELYFDTSTPPKIVKLAGYARTLHDWTKEDEDTYGELIIKIMLERTMGESTPYVQAARKWSGDRIVALARGNSVTVLWMIAFRDQNSADTFSRLYSGILDKVLPGSTARRVEQRSNVVFAMIGDGAIRSQEFLPEVWKQSTVGGAPIPATLQP
ncbi:MAG TPA: hypothetical protein VIX59_03335 [Candidatus Binataceae bacterium]